MCIRDRTNIKDWNLYENIICPLFFLFFLFSLRILYPHFSSWVLHWIQPFWVKKGLSFTRLCCKLVLRRHAIGAFAKYVPKLTELDLSYWRLKTFFSCFRFGRIEAGTLQSVMGYLWQLSDLFFWFNSRDGIIYPSSVAMDRWTVFVYGVFTKLNRPWGCEVRQ